MSNISQLNSLKLNDSLHSFRRHKEKLEISFLPFNQKLNKGLEKLFGKIIQSFNKCGNLLTRVVKNCVTLEFSEKNYMGDYDLMSPH